MCFNLDHQCDTQSGGLGDSTPMNLHDISPKAAKFATVGHYPTYETDRYPCVSQV